MQNALQRRALPEWIDLNTAVRLAKCCGATDEDFNAILVDGFQWGLIDVTGLLKFAPIERVRENFPARAAELNAMRSWRTPRRVEDFLARAAGVVCGTGNHLEAAIYWGIAARSIHSDSCILGAVHLRCSAIVSGLESAGFKVGEAGWKVLNAYAEDLPTQGDAATARLDTTPAGTPARPSEGKQSMEAEDPTPKHARRGPRSTRDAIRRAARRLKADGKVPGNNGTVPWDVYQKDICRLAGVEWDELSSKPKERGYSLDTIQNALRDMPPSLSINKTTESTEFTEN
jgi:hypothetical protein